MSDTTGGATNDPAGRGTHPGGADPNGRGTHPGSDVTNAPALVLDSSIFDCVSPQQLHALKIVQLEYAHAVSAAAASAYEKLIAEFRRTDGAPSFYGSKAR